MPQKPIPANYPILLKSLKRKIQTARVQASLSVNQELIHLYWQIGREILIQQEKAGWGGKVIEQLAKDLRREFPKMRGLSRTNLLYMRKLAKAWEDEVKVQQLVGQIPWGHNIRLLDRIKDQSEREWYIQGIICHGWSRGTLDYHIDSHLFERKGKGFSNFEQTLPPFQSELAKQLLKDPYNFDFLELSEKAKEKDVHKGLLRHLHEFLIELGEGFSFVGSEFCLEVDGKDYYVDLLFYHLQLRCFFVIELKVTDFKPEHAGKLNFYLSAVDDLLRHPDDQPSIGLIICRGKSGIVAEYSLRDIQKPVGIAGYHFSNSLPDKLKKWLPTIKDLETELKILK